MRILTIVDEHTRECQMPRADRVQWVRDVQGRLKKEGPQTLYIESGCPWQNGLVGASTEAPGTSA